MRKGTPHSFGNMNRIVSIQNLVPVLSLGEGVTCALPPQAAVEHSAFPQFAPMKISFLIVVLMCHSGSSTSEVKGQ
jgi:hypothetical protein